MFDITQSGADQALAFYDCLAAEVLDNDDSLEPEHYAGLSRYYGALRENAALCLFYCYNWARRVMPMVTLVLALPRRDVPWRILDAGCGVGTEAIFWSTLRSDVEVIGVDIAPDRLAVAAARQVAYERWLGRGLSLRFREQDVSSALEGQRLDLVWAMESISHIDPAHTFLSRVYQSLNAEGVVVISDSHLLNPAMLLRVLRLRASGVKVRANRTLSGGECLSYAQERLFTAGKLSSMLRRVGLQPVRSQFGVFFPPALARSWYGLQVGKWVDSLLGDIPLVRNLGGIYTLVAFKACWGDP